MSDADRAMLGVAKQLVDETTNVFALAASECVLVVDAADELGAHLIREQLIATGSTSAEATQILRSMRTSPRQPRRLIAFWIPRSTLLLACDGDGRGAIGKSLAIFDRAAIPGLLATVLRRDGVTTVCAIDYERVLPHVGMATHVEVRGPGVAPTVRRAN